MKKTEQSALVWRLRERYFAEVVWNLCCGYKIDISARGVKYVSVVARERCISFLYKTVTLGTARCVLAARRLRRVMAVALNNAQLDRNIMIGGGPQLSTYVFIMCVSAQQALRENEKQSNAIWALFVAQDRI